MTALRLSEVAASVGADVGAPFEAVFTLLCSLDVPGVTQVPGAGKAMDVPESSEQDGLRLMENVGLKNIFQTSPKSLKTLAF